ncbi:proteinase inhibitor I78 [Acidovorax sp. DW039]|uniref:I78 family peptidase inhibitor n=1 Tax=Acidovorax sp. DW039 TaxID=3095606 RepID=UPI00308C7241|nr:proteinase inhibitor I78 [Acidovorax sp. DW039]
MKNRFWMVAANTVVAGAAGLLGGCAGMGAGSYGNAPAGAATGAQAEASAAQCNAGPAQSFVGRDGTGSVVEAARVQSGSRMARILRPGQMVTKEYDAQRLNLLVDDAGRVTAVRCG